MGIPFTAHSDTSAANTTTKHLHTPNCSQTVTAINGTEPSWELQMLLQPKPVDKCCNTASIIHSHRRRQVCPSTCTTRVVHISVYQTKERSEVVSQVLSSLSQWPYGNTFHYTHRVKSAANITTKHPHNPNSSQTITAINGTEPSWELQILLYPKPVDKCYPTASIIHCHRRTHTHTHTHTQTHTHACPLTHTHTYTHSLIDTLTHSLAHQHARTHTATHTLTHSLTHSHTHTHTHTHIYIYIYTHTVYWG